MITQTITQVESQVAAFPVVKQVSQQVLAKRALSAAAMAELMPFGKTQRVVSHLLKDVELQSLTQKTVYLNRAQRVVSSKRLIEAFMTPGQRTAYLEGGQKCTPTTVINVIIKAVTCSQKQWEKVVGK